MAELLTILKQANSNLHFEKDVVERRAEMASQCECLAMWIEGRECICGDKTVSVPLSTASLKKAKDLVDQIEDCDRRLARIAEINDGSAVFVLDKYAMKMRASDGRSVCWGHGEERYGFRVTLPKSVVIAALTEERIRLIIALHETGIVSVDRPNIKANPK